MLTTFGEHRQRYDILMTQLAVASRRLSYFSGLWSNRDKFDNDLFWCRDFWYDTASAHMNAMVVNLCRVYDHHKRGINLLTFLRRVKAIAEKPPQWLASDQVDVAQLSSDISMLEAKVGTCDPSLRQLIVLIDRLRHWRNKIVAHHDDQIAIFDSARFRLNHPWELRDFEDLIAQGVVILDRYALSQGRDLSYTEALVGLRDREIAGKVVCQLSASAPPE